MAKKSDSNRPIIDLLNQILQVEYSIIVYYPRLVNMVTDIELKKYANILGSASIGHADAVASAIRLLGGTPKWAFDSPPEGDDIVKTFKAQLEKEKTAAELHRKVAAMFTDPSMKASFLQFSKDETHHEELVEKILQKINQ